MKTPSLRPLTMPDTDKQPANTSPQPAAQDQAPPRFSEQDKSNAGKWFERAQTVADSRNYDYAIECYINGLEKWPEAVEGGHKRLLAVGMARRAAGKKKASVLEALKHSVNARDPKQGMLNAEFLLAKDPGNPANMEGLLRNAAKAQFDETVCWIGPLLLDAVAREKKPSASRLRTAYQIFEQAGDRTQQAGEYKIALQLYQCGVTALEYFQQVKPNDLGVVNILRDMASKLTIVKGNYQKAEDFRGSLQDADQQRVLHDEDRLIQSEQRLEELAEKARKDLEADPTNANKITRLAELLCRHEDEPHEKEAIELLMNTYAQSKNYRFKVRADDIRMRQFRRQARTLVAQSKEDPENGLLRQRAAELADNMRQLELAVFKERVENYPTDLGTRFEYGVRLFQAARHDDAIPMLQGAQTDPRNRQRCRLYIGRCFFAKGYHSQAIEVLTQALGEHEIKEDEIGREMHYWLGRASEESGDAKAALKTFGQIIQWDYNYKDVRRRIDKLRGTDG